MLRFKLVALTLVFAAMHIHAKPIIDTNNYRALTSDVRAFRIGEPVIILVAQAINAESSAGTGVRNDVDIDLRAFDSVKSVSAGLGASGSDEGSGQTSRKGRVNTQLSARIIEILPNDMYRISGKQNLVINGETQKISLAGVIRARDISKNNTLPSNRIADAEIEIIGDGDVSDAQRKSIFYKVFRWLGIF